MPVPSSKQMPNVAFSAALCVVLGVCRFRRGHDHSCGCVGTSVSSALWLFSSPLLYRNPLNWKRRKSQKVFMDKTFDGSMTKASNGFKSRMRHVACSKSSTSKTVSFSVLNERWRHKMWSHTVHAVCSMHTTYSEYDFMIGMINMKSNIYKNRGQKFKNSDWSLSFTIYSMNSQSSLRPIFIAKK